MDARTFQEFLRDARFASSCSYYGVLAGLFLSCRDWTTVTPMLAEGS